jgi:hypothetical protein
LHVSHGFEEQSSYQSGFMNALTPPDHPAAGKAGVASWLAIEDHWPGVAALFVHPLESAASQTDHVPRSGSKFWGIHLVAALGTQIP